MFSAWTEHKCEYWRARYYDAFGEVRTYTFRHLPKGTPKNEVLQDLMPDAATAYVKFLHSDKNLWRRLEVRNYDLNMMYARVRDFHKHYPIELFAFDLRELGIIPAEAKVAAKARVQRKRNAKKLTNYNKQFKYQGKERTLKEWASISGISRTTLNMRLIRGWNIGDALTTPPLTASDGGTIGAERRWKRNKDSSCK